MATNRPCPQPGVILLTTLSMVAGQGYVTFAKAVTLPRMR